VTSLFASGHIIDAILVLTLLECLCILIYRARTRRGPAPTPFVVNVLAGVCLMIALRCALTGGWWGWIALCLIGSLVLHLADLAHRWTGRKPN
jgi:hypothetical protein